MFIGLLVFVLIILLVIVLIFKKLDKLWKKLLGLVLTLVLAGFIGIKLALPMHPALKPQGSLPVKVDKIYYIHDTGISGMETGEGKEREVPITVWSPEDLKEEQYPLFLFSPGSFGTATSNESLFLELASRGYIVMGIDHPHQSFFSEMSDGKEIRADRSFLKEVMASQGSKDLKGTWESLDKWLEIRLEDNNFILDKLLDDQEENQYEAKIDQSRIILSGHSLGGAAQLGLGRQRPKDIQALVILESPFAKDIEGIEGEKYVFTDEEYPLPILHIYSDSLWGKMDSITTYDMNQRLIAMKSPRFVNEHIEGSGHIGLTDFRLLSPILTNMIDQNLNSKDDKEVLEELNSYVLDFLDRLQ